MKRIIITILIMKEESTHLCRAYRREDRWLNSGINSRFNSRFSSRQKGGFKRRLNGRLARWCLQFYHRYHKNEHIRDKVS